MLCFENYTKFENAASIQLIISITDHKIMKKCVLNFSNQAYSLDVNLFAPTYTDDQKNTFEQPKVVSEVIFLRSWGVVCNY